MRQPSGKTHLYAILGHPIAHVRAPEFLNPLIERAGRDAFVVPFHVLPEDLEEVVPRLVAIRNLRGFIVTIPHKPAMARMCAELGPAAEATGTANTVRLEETGRLVGDMFDGVGLVEGAKAEGMDPTGRSVLMVGTGGAGRAIALSLAQCGVKRLVLANRTASKAEELARLVRARVPDCAVSVGPADATGHDLVVNATSLGLHAEDALPVDPATFAEGTALFDIIAARDTELMRAVRARGCPVAGGRPMVEHQAAAQIAFLDAPMLPGAKP
ncbi:MAG: shikimate dehydrogenase [Geminicoccaceae bacterium]|nr:shikimate dehydrogenase [Geminicoccaceae bacterium]